MIAWHFLRVDQTLRTGEPVDVGSIWKVPAASIKLCEAGLHASIKAIDALQYAPGPIITRVRCGGVLLQDEDKLVCSEREVLSLADASEVLWAFARWSALQVIDSWNAPQVVRDFLESGDPALQDAASSAADSAAYHAAQNAASSTAPLAAYHASNSAAHSAADSAANSAAYHAALSAACYAANSAARTAQNQQLEKQLYTLLSQEPES